MLLLNPMVYQFYNSKFLQSSLHFLLYAMHSGRFARGQTDEQHEWIELKHSGSRPKSLHFQFIADAGTYQNSHQNQQMPASNSIPLIFNCSGKTIKGNKAQKEKEAIYSEGKLRAPPAKQLGQHCMALKPQ